MNKQGPEIEKIECKKCKVSNFRVRVKIKVYKDLRGRTWGGRTCPTCYYKEQAARNKSQMGEKLIQPPSKRKCIECGEVLPISKYFRHEECISEEMRENSSWLEDSCGINLNGF